jgi:2-polyprenyl-6-methoxyphenol hydroxylase-like FAD-dependent oxidoreductase
MDAGHPRQSELRVRCCIVGGGPAGMMLGYLLARSGIQVAVLEKHRDFLRDFRGDTIHPSTLQVMSDLGILDEFLERPHQKVDRLAGQVGDEKLTIADFSHLPVRCPYIAFMPQWDFLDFLHRQASGYPGFSLLMETDVRGLIERNGVVGGVRAVTPVGELVVRADLVVGADGRHSTVREEAGLECVDLGAPMDVLWMRIPRKPDDPAETFGRIDRGGMLVLIDRRDYWQCAFVIEKGSAAAVRSRGIEAFRADVARFAPFLADRVGTLKNWDEIKLLTVAVNRLRRWYRPGLLCIGDAAHAMSPVGGVGINLAIQDAVAAANILAEPLRERAAGSDALRLVQRRRSFPARATQRLQLFVQDRVIRRALAGGSRPALPAPARLLRRFPALQRIPGRLIGLGIRPEHPRTTDISP